jgi:hypothetical protein
MSDSLVAAEIGREPPIARGEDRRRQSINLFYEAPGANADVEQFE